MWNSLSALLGFTSHDFFVIWLCVVSSLLGSLAHITILTIRRTRQADAGETFNRVIGYGFLGIVIGLTIGLIGAGILLDTPHATRTVLLVALVGGWKAHLFFKGQADAA